MLLQTLRQSHALARWVLVWFVLAMGVAVAAPSMQPVKLSTICSASSAALADGAPDGMDSAAHHGLQCVLCLGASAPPLALASVVFHTADAHSVILAPTDRVALAPRRSPLAARAPPLR